MIVWVLEHRYKWNEFPNEWSVWGIYSTRKLAEKCKAANNSTNDEWIIHSFEVGTE